MVPLFFQDAIHRIKVVFNKEFDEVFVKKEQEIAKIKEKNKRIHKIIADLEVIEDVIEPSMSVAEKPESLLEVQDDEVSLKQCCCKQESGTRIVQSFTSNYNNYSNFRLQ